MQLTSFSVFLLASAASIMASPILIERQEQSDSTYAITTPAAQDTIVAGHATTISWTPGKNTPPLTIGLTDAEGSDITNLASDVNGSTGSFLVNIPGNIANCTEHKIVIQYNDKSTSSETFYIAAEGTDACVAPNVSDSDLPDASLAADKLSGATATASIDILDNQGNPMLGDQSFAIKTSTPVTFLTALGVTGVSYLMMTL
ncbi:hypothetical protein BDA99DRAFT_506439 [Phascolomyces articulosus]|uniref:Uncharacterized protein n=1 Tax=Phascolomyces articulosus TaxID=60185 RepID=A0AAD5K2W2_9FUNG|nr:hypothetical protein BDA99DRAFT_506439 [Phascolomyces articulosus]